ncbi:nuclear transport factor 2 family protein [Cronobacter muytjensii]|nr:nuclear transport factor 2 family protein [Cronobacter muytjensii]
MADNASELAPFVALLKNALGDKVIQTAKTFPDMMAPAGVMEFPYAPDGCVTLLKGRDAIAAYIAGFGDLLILHSLTLDRVYHTDEGNVTIIEFSATGTGARTGRPYPQRYISVITTRDGFITRYVDYWNPRILLSAVGQDVTTAKGDAS